LRICFWVQHRLSKNSAKSQRGRDENNLENQWATTGRRLIMGIDEEFSLTHEHGVARAPPSAK
jgi:hypothetical protein